MPQRSGIWYRADRRVWCGRVDGQVVSLGSDEGAARLRWRELTGQSAGLTVAELAARWLAWQETRVAAGKIAPATLEIYRERVVPLSQLAGSRLAASVTGSDVIGWLNGRPSWSIASRAIYGRSWAMLFRWGHRAGLIACNPLADLVPPPPAPRRRHATPEQARAVLAAVRSDRMRDLLTFLWLTGCRPGEAYRLTAADCDLDAGVAVLARHKCARTGRARVIPLPPAAVAIVRRWGELYPSGPVFRNRDGRPWTIDAVGVYLTRTARDTGCPRLFPYQFRALWATDALAAGEAPAIVAEALGHSVRTLERFYSGLDARHELLRALAARVRAG